MQLISRISLYLCCVLAFANLSIAQGTWVVASAKAPVDLVAVYFTSADKGWVAGDNGYLAWTINRGQTWTKYPLGTTESINEIYFRNDKNGYLVAGKKMFLTKDG